MLSASVAAQAVVQALPNPAAERLNAALRRLSRNPESLPALISAGRASVELGDIDAAEGFFRRAQSVDSGSGDAMAGMAVVALRRQDAVSALDMFEAAAQAGANIDVHAADHGLAFDLVGQNAAAQELYGRALAQSETDEVVRRLSLSHAIGGDQYASEAILLPLLQRRDLAAYRTRAFALAILGREEEAVAIAETMLPARIARRLEPYLRYMPQLTRSQQAAAANLGRFPAVDDIGRDDPQLARRMELPTTPRSSSGGADQRLIPEGEPLGSPPPEPVQQEEELPAVAVAVAEPAAVPLPAPETPSPDAAPPPEPVELALVPGPSFSISEAPADAPASQAAEEISLADAFSDFSLAGSGSNVLPAAGAVDITTIEPVREERLPEPPPPPAHPSRHWVQVATGQDTGAFRFDWRRVVRSANGALDGFDPYRARWNQTNRLITGPFDTAGEAQRFVTRLAEQGVDAFRFTSAEGEEVTPLN